MMKFVKYDIKKIEILLMLLFVAFQSRAYDFEKDGIYYNFNGTIPFEVFVCHPHLLYYLLFQHLHLNIFLYLPLDLLLY